MNNSDNMQENKFQHYLPEEDDLIISMANDGKATWHIADALRRTEVSIYWRRKKLGVDPGPWPMSKKYLRMRLMKTK